MELSLSVLRLKVTLAVVEPGEMIWGRGFFRSITVEVHRFSSVQNEMDLWIHAFYAMIGRFSMICIPHSRKGLAARPWPENKDELFGFSP